jgi:hypothetical protein
MRFHGLPYFVKTRFLSILLLVAIACQVPFGMLSGRFIVCFGGEHEHAEHAEVGVVSACEHACSHDAEWPLPVDDDHDDHNCCCTDLELAVASLLSTIRHDSDAALPTMPPLAIIPIVTAQPDAFAWRGPPRQRIDDPGGQHRLACIRTIRLNV